MNVERLQQLAAHLRTLERTQFDMREWFMNRKPVSTKDGWVEYDCGTPACIAGHAVAMFHELDLRAPLVEQLGMHTVCTLAEELLDLQMNQSIPLFMPPETSADGIRMYDATPQQAAEVIEHFINTGEVDWQRVIYRKDEVVEQPADNTALEEQPSDRFIEELRVLQDMVENPSGQWDVLARQRAAPNVVTNTRLAKLERVMREYADPMNWCAGKRFDPNSSNFNGISTAIAALKDDEG